MKQKRLHWIDVLRGVTVISMIAYHALWDAVFMYGYHIEWFHSNVAYIWQQSICWTFILLAGFCWHFDKHPLKRGTIVSLMGFVITFVTSIAAPSSRIVFGVLNLLGACILLMIPFQKIADKVHRIAGLLVSLLLFGLTRNCANGYLGFEQFNLYKLPDYLYQNIATTFLGFPEAGFISSDYFPLIPWFFLFLSGYYLHAIYENNKSLMQISGVKIWGVSQIGKHAFIVYLLHQPVISFLFELLA